MTDLQIEKILELLQNCNFTNYYIAKNTGISNSTLKNYKEKRTKPTHSAIKILEQFFESEKAKINHNSSKNVIADQISNTTINQLTNEKVLQDQLIDCNKLVEFLKNQIDQKDRTIEFLLKNQK